MSIQIINNGASLKIVRDGTSRLILKSQIKNISASGTNLKIEVSGCGDSCLFLPFSEISDPEVDNLPVLLEEINGMLNSGVGGGSPAIEGFSTELKQTETLAKIEEVKTTLQDATAQLNLSIQQGFLGKSTEAKQTEQSNKLQDILGNVADSLNQLYTLESVISNALAGKATAVLQTDGNNKLQNIMSFTGDTLNAVDALSVEVSNGLSGKSTSAKQDDQLTWLQNIKTVLDNLNTAIANLQTGVVNSITTELAGKSTEAQQIDILNKLTETKTAVEDVPSFINDKLEEVMVNLRSDFAIANKLEVALRMDTDLGTIYKGFAEAGTAEALPQWAIQRITSTGEGNQTIEWAGGNKDFVNSWTNRTTLIYS